MPLVLILEGSLPLDSNYPKNCKYEKRQSLYSHQLHLG